MLQLLSLQLVLLVLLLLLLLSINQLCCCYCYNYNNLKNKHNSYNNNEGLLSFHNTIHFHRCTVLKNTKNALLVPVQQKERLQLQLPVRVFRRQLSTTRTTTTTTTTTTLSSSKISSTNDNINNYINDNLKNVTITTTTDNNISTTNNTNDTILSIGTFIFHKLWINVMILNRIKRFFSKYSFSKNNINLNINNIVRNKNTFINYIWDASINTNTGIAASNEISRSLLQNLSDGSKSKNSIQGIESIEKLFTQLFFNYPLWLLQFNTVCKLLFVQEQQKQKLLDNDNDDVVKASSNKNSYSIRTRIFNLNLLTFGPPHLINIVQQQNQQDNQDIIGTKDNDKTTVNQQKQLSTIQVHIPIYGGLLAMPITGSSTSSSTTTTAAAIDKSRTINDYNDNTNIATETQHDDANSSSSPKNKGLLVFTMRLHTQQHAEQQQQQQQQSNSFELLNNTRNENNENIINSSDTTTTSSSIPLVVYCCQIETNIVSSYQPTIGTIVSLLLQKKKKSASISLYLQRINSSLYLYTQSIIHTIVMWRFHKYCHDSFYSVLRE